MKDVHQVAIVGAGPAGIACAIYLKRAGINLLLLEHNTIGGLLVNANLVGNYPGFPNGITGERLAVLFRMHLHRCGIQVTKARVRRIERDGEDFRLHVDGSQFRSRYLVVATGTRAKSIKLRGLGGLIGVKIFYEVASLPARSSKSKFVVIGGGDAAFDYALGLAGRGGDVDLVFRSEQPTSLPLLRERVVAESRIHEFAGTTPVSVSMRHSKVELSCRKLGRKIALHGDYALVACGREPSLEILSPGLRASLRADAGCEGRSRMFMIGDVRRGDDRQVGIAVGDGMLAAMRIVDLIRREGAA